MKWSKEKINDKKEYFLSQRKKSYWYVHRNGC